MTFTLHDMQAFATEAWGQLGTGIVDRWAEFNATFFNDELRPIPVIVTKTLPFGAKIGLCHLGQSGTGRSISLNCPSCSQSHALLADNNTLLHEMIHQYLDERGENSKHIGPGWRREIMRLHLQLTGTEIWAGRSTTARQKIDGISAVVRINAANRETGAVSLTQAQIASWPRSTGIDLGSLGM
jgi:hypothetical protein